jgi:hypothetical protein
MWIDKIFISIHQQTRKACTSRSRSGPIGSAPKSITLEPLVPLREWGGSADLEQNVSEFAHLEYLI